MDYSPFFKDEPFILTVAGCKQGCGKSLVSVNMAIQYAQAGLKVLLIDHDLSAANLQTLYDISKEQKKIFFENPKTSLQKFLLEEGIPNLLMIPGNSFGLGNINTFHKAKFFNQIKEISSADIVIIDIGEEIIENTLDIFLMAHAGIMVTTTETSSVINTYEFLKNAVYRTIFRMFRGQGQTQATIQNVLGGKDAQQASSIKQLASAVAKESPWVAQVLMDVCGLFDFYIILNEAKSPQDVRMGEKLHIISKKHLQLDLNLAGLLYFDHSIPSHTEQLAPLSVTHSKSVTCQTIQRMASFVLNGMIKHNAYNIRAATFEEQLEAITLHAKKDHAALQQNTKHKQQVNPRT